MNMVNEFNITAIADQIGKIKTLVIQMKDQSAGIPAVENNADRILASIKMLEINISDLADIVE